MEMPYREEVEGVREDLGRAERQLRETTQQKGVLQEQLQMLRDQLTAKEEERQRA